MRRVIIQYDEAGFQNPEELDEVSKLRIVSFESAIERNDPSKGCAVLLLANSEEATEEEIAYFVNVLVDEAKWLTARLIDLQQKKE